MKDPYSILGVSPNATDDEVKAAYRELVRKYHPDNYTDDNPLKDLAAEKMQEINKAYDDIQNMRSSRKSGASSGGSYSGGSGGYSSDPRYAEIRRMINSRRYNDASRALFEIPTFDRGAEWHYLMSVILMGQGRPNDAMRELEIACSLDPENLEYQRAKEMFNTTSRGYGSTYYGGTSRPRSSAADDACNCCTNLICMDCLCECMGGDLIPCL